jgi:hypothetical protein
MRKTIIQSALLSAFFMVLLEICTAYIKRNFFSAYYDDTIVIILLLLVIENVAFLVYFRRKVGSELSYSLSLLVCSLASGIAFPVIRLYWWTFSYFHNNEPPIKVFQHIISTVSWIVMFIAIDSLICLFFRKPTKHYSSLKDILDDGSNKEN